MSPNQPWRRAGSGVLALIGFVLSPLSWWNDLVVNMPLAYAFSIPFTLLDDRLYLPAFVLGYWLTNIIGLIMLHKGVSGAVNPDKPHSYRTDVIVSLLYTALITLLVSFGWLPSPLELLPR